MNRRKPYYAIRMTEQEARCVVTALKACDHRDDLAPDGFRKACVRVVKRIQRAPIRFPKRKE